MSLPFVQNNLGQLKLAGRNKRDRILSKNSGCFSQTHKLIAVTINRLASPAVAPQLARLSH